MASAARPAWPGMGGSPGARSTEMTARSPGTYLLLLRLTEPLDLARKEKPDIITLDISMPGKSGVEVFGELRADPAIADIPVCVVTGHPEFRQVIYDRAVPPPDGYINKPVKESKLVEDVRRILELKEKKAAT